MKTVAINLQGITKAANFKCLPPSWIIPQTDIRVILVPEVTSEIDGLYVKSNVDFIVDFSHSTTESRHPVIPTKLVTRLAKDIQTHHINTAAINLPNFLPIPMYPCDFNRKRPIGDYVIKVSTQARGIAQLFVPAKYHQQAILLELANEPVDAEAWSEKYPGVILSTHGENRPGESAKVLQRSSNLFIQPHIKNIAVEYRLLVADIGSEYRILRKQRNLLGGPYPQPDVSDHILQDKLETARGEHFYTPHAETIKAFIQRLNPIFGSVDIFFTEDGKWGCFEYQPEFCASEFPPEEIYRLHEDFINDLTKRYLEGDLIHG